MCSHITRKHTLTNMKAWDTEKLDEAVEADSEAFQTREDKIQKRKTSNR